MKLVLEQEDTDANFQVSRGALCSGRDICFADSDAHPHIAQIHAADKGPKVFSLGTAGSNGYNSFDVSTHSQRRLARLPSGSFSRPGTFSQIRGTYMLSNLLQELALARDHGQKQIVLDEARLNENPVSRLSRMIRNSFWSNLTRRIDGDGLEKICADPKVSKLPLMLVNESSFSDLACAEPRIQPGPAHLGPRS